MSTDMFEKYVNYEELSSDARVAWGEVAVCHNEISEIVSRVNVAGYWGSALEAANVVSAYLLAKISKYNNPLSFDFEDLANLDINDDVLDLAKSYKLDKVWEAIRNLSTKHESKIFYLAANLQDVHEENSTPDGIIELAVKLLDLKETDIVADYCCGSNKFAKYVDALCPRVKVKGYESNREAIIIEQIREELYGKKFDVRNMDVFSLANECNMNHSFDKIFSNYPFGQRIRELGYGKEFLDNLIERVPAISKATSSDWLYNMLMAETLKDGGKAIGIMTNGSTWNIIDSPIRKYFVENGLIECVIALPAKLFANTAIPTTMVVLSHGNESIRLIDATNHFLAGRRVNTLSSTNIEAILKAVTEDNEMSMTVSVEELRENDYVLSTNRYSRKSDVADGAKFESVIKRITRGAQLNAKELDEITSFVPTDMQYLMLANIKDGIIDSNLPYISQIDKKNEKYCLSNHCLIISKNGYPYKIAVAEIKDGQKIMANGNMYVVEVDEEKVSPYYLAAYFGSEHGIAALKSITVGSTIPNIGVEQLKKLIIPLPGIEKQQQIVERYQKANDEIMMLQLKLEKAKNRMMHIFEEEGV